MNTVDFREFEDRDVDFVLRCKNDAQLNSRTVGAYKPMSREEAVRWVQGCMGDHPSYKYWAVCTNDDERRIVGWVSLSQIDKANQSACFHGIVIGDPQYRDGAAWIESYLFIIDYAFEVLGVNRLFGSRLDNQNLTAMMGQAVHFTVEGVRREAVFRDGAFHDVYCTSILRSEYIRHKADGEFCFARVMASLMKIARTARKDKREKAEQKNNRTHLHP